MIRKTRKSTWMCVVALGCAALVLTNSSVFGNIYKFQVIPQTVNSSPWPEDSGLDLFVETTILGSQVEFKFQNKSSFNCSLTQIYFDDDAGLFAGIFAGGLDWGSQTGVDFVQGTNNGKLPGGENLNPRLEASDPQLMFSASPTSPVAPNGINVDEWLVIKFNLNTAKTANDIIDAFADKTMRIGVHVQAFPDGASASFTTSTPEPATLALLGLGTMLLRKRN